MDPELARLVVRGRDHASPMRVAADDEGLRAEIRILELLDRREKRIEVEVRDDHAESLDLGPPGTGSAISDLLGVTVRARARPHPGGGRHPPPSAIDANPDFPVSLHRIWAGLPDYRSFTRAPTRRRG